MRKIIAAPIVVGLIGMAALAAPLAAHAADTPGTFQVNGGSLSISAPTASVSLGSYSLVTDSNHTISGSLGTVTVTDLRATVSGSWTTGVTSTDFVTGTGTTATAARTVPAADINYSPGSTSAAVNSPTTTYSPGTAAALDNTTALTAMSTSSEVGSGGVSWDPTITVTLPAQVVAGTYSGTITHSVA